MKIVRLDEVPSRSYQSPKGRFAGTRQEISVALGARLENPLRLHPFEIELVTLPPGALNFPYHSHSAEFELYVIVSGRGQVRDLEGLIEISAGDCFVFPPGQPHQLINNSEAPLSYYVVANNVPTDACFYPDSNKWAIDPVESCFRITEAPYYDGEE